ncbi:MAG: YihY/virulence factor BrkB family protein [Fimbriimonadales bacterium]|nr:YihY/virulence factor BrkB family protein [Fimbriimonadales bacterium]
MKALYQFGLRVADLWARHAVARHAAALAFFTMLTLAPLLLALVGVAGYFLGGEQATAQILSGVRRVLGEGAARGVEQLIQRTVLQGSGAGATLMGLALAWWGASGLMQSLKASLDALWDAPPHAQSSVANWLITRLIGAAGVLLLTLLLLLSVALEVALTVVRTRLPDHLPGVYWLGWALNRSLLPALLVLGNALLYWLLPATRPRFRDALLGALVCTLLLLGMRTLISLYLSYSSVATLYGSAGSLVALLLWVYFSAQAFFLGAIVGIVRKQDSATMPAA